MFLQYVISCSKQTSIAAHNEMTVYSEYLIHVHAFIRMCSPSDKMKSPLLAELSNPGEGAIP